MFTDSATCPLYNGIALISFTDLYYVREVCLHVIGAASREVEIVNFYRSKRWSRLPLNWDGGEVE